MLNILGLNDNHIDWIDQHHGLQTPAKEAFLAMQRQAKEDGVDLQIASSYRSFERQHAIWQGKWNGNRPVYSLSGDLLDMHRCDELEKVHRIMTWSALPGASRHHWGTDIDVYDKQACQQANVELQLVPAEYHAGGPCYALHQWLTEHALDYDFYRPYEVYNNGVAPEPWHLSYRPIAKKIICAIDIDALRSQLESINIGGKSIILKHLAALFERYTLNGEAE